MSAPNLITVTSPAFGDFDRIPARYTCDGADVSPPLAWQDVPPETQALALILDDPDAPRGTFVHWVVLDLPPDTTELPESYSGTSVVQGKNSAGNPSYFGPCPPSGTHHYRFTVYALPAPTGLNHGASLDQAREAVSLALAQGRLTGLYSR
ncbi:PBP family phospholipid-binding protein [Kribbella amoyensis]|uniref:PBP family phospholipid-binding protein n=2 Tax=Kribbella amoyensis TaxID=996641 RepID=A0A561BUF5_9ACTN|nr:PBP family phospholipid-binding protein [Kribbella amoyensis]